MNTRYTHEINGIWLTERQYKILAGFAGVYYGDTGRTEWTITARGGISWGWDNTLSSTEPVFRALAKKGIFEVREEDFVPRGWSPDNAMKREVFTLSPGVAQHFRDIREAGAKQAAARERERQAEQDRREAQEAAKRREQRARAMAVEALIKTHQVEYAELLQAAFASLDSTATAVTAGESIKSIQENGATA